MKKIVLLFSGLFLCTYNLVAQTAAWSWEQHAGSVSYELANSITSDNNGHLIVTGTFSSPSVTIGATTLTNGSITDYSDFFIAKYDTAGNAIWVRSFGGVLSDDAYDVTTDAAGNVFVTGAFTSRPLVIGTDSLYCTDASGDSADVFIAAFDSSGNPLWARSATGMGLEEGNSIKSDASGNVYITGEFDSDTLYFGTQYIVNHAGGNSYDAFLAKYNSTGNLQWARCAGGTNYEFSKSVSLLPNGNVVTTGYSYSDSIVLTIGTVYNNSNSGYSDIFSSCYDASGNLIWSDMCGGTSDEMANDVTSDANGDIVVVGSAWSPLFYFGTDSFTIYSAFGTDAFLLKYDSNGNPQWITSAGGQNDDAATSVYCDAQNNIFIGGSYGSPICHFGSLTLNNATPGYGDIYVAQYDQGGTEVAVLSAGGTQSDGLLGIAGDGAGGIYGVGAYYSNPCHFGTAMAGCAGWCDLFIAKWSVIWTGIDYPASLENVQVFPNPFADRLNISVTNDGRVDVYNAQGQMVRRIALLQGQNSIELPDLSAGVYFLQIIDGTESHSIRVIRSRPE